MSALIQEYPATVPTVLPSHATSGARHLRVADPVDPSTHPRAAIAMGAARLIDETDRWTWSIREICDEALVPYNAFHRTFRKKTALVDELTALWREELDEFIGSAQGLAHLERHLAWLVIHRRRVHFLVAEAGVLDGERSMTAALDELLPSAWGVRKALGLRGTTDVGAMRGALASAIFLVGYLTGFDTMRGDWSTHVAFVPGDPMEGGSPVEVEARLEEFLWLRNTLALQAGLNVEQRPMDAAVLEALTVGHVVEAAR